MPGKKGTCFCGDYKLISDQLVLWCQIVDTKDLARMREVFLPSVVWDFGKGTVDHGLENVVERIRAHLLEQEFCGPTHHHLSNLRIDVDESGERAQSEAYFFAAHTGAGPYLGKNLLQWGSYFDQWRQIDGDWRIAKRKYRIDISDGPIEIVYGNNTGHLWQEGDDRRIMS